MWLLLRNWKLWLFGFAALAAAIAIGTQTYRLNSAIADAKVAQAERGVAEHNAAAAAAFAGALSEAVGREHKAAENASANLRTSRVERDVARTALRAALAKESDSNATLDACFALQLPDGVLRQLP